ncbi:protein phosphatase 1 regulatory subunit 12A-like isoform X2 [Aethina tumida]|uniref:protein phosphatase 1 regulatory subunit 12A-like isoform X2 n=1 Tax=Aethina tumida TaxID=116153 RepID=UPI0021481AEE|nr:protein phosphatase 1 regulatory subunit 12A-like isoform X2 [Aethina tumida]
MSLETRSNSALFKRAEQLKRWEESDTNREPPVPKQKSRKIKFSSGCVFLAACASGDKDEVLGLLQKGADIDTANVDGLTALHQACIDDNLDMVEFLVEHGADVNRGDNEGWTPLHATSSCGFLYIAKYLVEKGANVAAVNNDGELAIDIAEDDRMKNLLQDEVDKRGIDCDAARNEEERIMLRDAKEWLATKSSQVNHAHPKHGATPLHVASAKGYSDVIKILLQCGADVDAQDVDGWTAMHAAAHWGQEEACQLLAEGLADLDAKNFVGQTPFDVSDTDMFRFLEELKKKQNADEVMNRRQAKKRAETRASDAETPTKLKKVEVEITGADDSAPIKKNDENVEMDVTSESESESETETSSSESESSSSEDEKKNGVNVLTDTVHNNVDTITRLPPTGQKQIVENNAEETPAWRKGLNKNKPESPTKTASFVVKNNGDTDEVTLRRSNSLGEEKSYTRNKTLHERIQAYKNKSDIIPYSKRPNSDTILIFKPKVDSKEEKSDSQNSVSTTTSTTSTPSKTSPASSPVPAAAQTLRSGLKLPIGKEATPSTPTTTTSTTPTTPTTPGGTRLQMFKNFFKSFVPPVRDEESETQRKAHAKRVRETRRSTQGVTLEEIKSAEQYVKKSQTNNNKTDTSSGPNGDANGGGSTQTVTATITTAAPTVPTTRDSADEAAAAAAAAATHERRPSWRLRVDNGTCKFKLEDATKPAEPPSTPSFVRRAAAATGGGGQRPTSAPVETADATVTLPLRRPKSLEEKDQDKENDVRNAQATLATQAAIQRRRRPKRRSTGVVNFDNVDDCDQDKESSGAGDYDDLKINHQESGVERNSRSRTGSNSDIRNENGEIDYKKLYEQQLAENDRLKDKLKKSEEELRETKQTLEKINLVTSKNSLSELEKRERRAMERKLSEMEEELKHLETLKSENQRLKDENGALIRVISKLSK